MCQYVHYTKIRYNLHNLIYIPSQTLKIKYL